MKNVWKLLFMLCVLALVALTAFAFGMLFLAPSSAMTILILSVLVVIAASWCVKGLSEACLTKRFTSATGIG